MSEPHALVFIGTNPLWGLIFREFGADLYVKYKEHSAFSARTRLTHTLKNAINSTSCDRQTNYSFSTLKIPMLLNV